MGNSPDNATSTSSLVVCPNEKTKSPEEEMKRPAALRAICHSNSIVPGGFDVQS